MEVEAMLKQPELLAGLGDLLEDPDPVVVKRIIRVFANVYRYAVGALVSGDINEATYIAAWPSVKDVSEKLMRMLATAENEGVIIHIVRFLEAALVSHLVSDVSHFKQVSEDSLLVINKGVDCLTDLLTTPYVGGSSFIVAMRAIITVACYKPDIREDVISLIEKQISSPPPTLFDHNVRSLNKILQRNLFRILRRTSSLSLRGRLIEMMVTVGVSRRLLHQWAPPAEGRKRPVQEPNQEDIISGRNSPPSKRSRKENNSDDEGRTIPVAKDPRLARESRNSEESMEPRDFVSSVQQDELKDPTMSPKDPRLSPADIPLPPKSNTPPPQRKSPPRSPSASAQSSSHGKQSSKTNSPSTSGRSTPEGNKENIFSDIKAASSSNFEFLKNLITSTKESTAAKPFLEKCSDKEKSLYERLDHPRVVEVVLYCLESVPDSPPDDLLSQLGYSGGDVNGIREHLTKTLAPHITEEFINSLTPPHEPSGVPTTNPANLSRPSSTSSASTAFSSRSSPPSTNRESSPPSPPSSNRSTPTDPNLVCASDVDLRKYLDKGFSTSKDVDMRTNVSSRKTDPRFSRMNSNQDSKSNSRNSPIDPRLSRDETKTVKGDPRISKAPAKSSEGEQSVQFPQSNIIDPRITSNNDPRQNPNDRIPSLLQPFSDFRDPRGMPPNQMMNDQNNFGNFNNEPNFPNNSMNPGMNFPGMGGNPRMNMLNGNFNQNFGNKFGMHCGMNYPDPRMGNMPNMNFGNGPPSNIQRGMNMPAINNAPGIFGPGPVPNLAMNNGPWSNMPMQGNGQGLFSQTPPMHL